MNSLAWIAAVILILWIVLRVALAITSGILHLLWIVALVMLAVWLYNKFRGRAA